MSASKSQPADEPLIRRGGKKRELNFCDKVAESERKRLAAAWEPSWQSDIVSVSVDSPPVNVSVHESVLIAPLFKAALEGPWTEASTKKLVLPEVEQETFELYMPWMYARAIWDVSWNATEPEDWLMLCKSYVFADYIQDLDYRKQVVRQLLLLAESKTGDVPDPLCIKWVYEHTEDSSPLRRLLRDVCVETWDAAGKTTKETFIDYPHDFVSDLASRALNLLRFTYSSRSLDTSHYFK